MASVLLLFVASALALSAAGPVAPPNATVTAVSAHVGGVCRTMMDKIHEFLEGMDMEDYMEYEKEYDVRCDDHGNFEPRQCHAVAEGETWCACVDTWTGKVRPNTMTKGEHLVCDEYGMVTKPCCPPEWTHFSEHHHEHCFQFIRDSKTWAEAESYCQYLGGHLASIHCEETNHFLTALALGEGTDFPLSWVGGSTAPSSSFWLWSDGTHFEFEDWYKEDYKFRKSSCLRINAGYHFQWSSGCCNETLPFVCSKETECWKSC